MPPELDIVREWLRKASDDLEAARRLLAVDPPLVGIACFHCQQAVEKSVKGFLEFREVRPARTHALSRLFDAAEALEPRFSEIRDCEWLTDFAVRARYPGTDVEPGMDQAEQALAESGRALEFILSILPPEAHP